MSQLVIPNTIDAGTEIVASEHQQNYVAIRDLINGNIEGGSGVNGNLKADGITARELANLLMLRGLPSESDAWQEGVVLGGDIDITPGAGLVLNYAAGTAWVKDDSGVLAPGALIPVTVSSGSVTIAANASGNPRIDQIILTMNGHGTGTVSVLQGTATAGATLDNRNGAAALPNDAIRLADILMANGFAGPFVEKTSIRDRRPWANGANVVRVDTTTAGPSGGAFTVGATSTQPRFEVSGNGPILFVYDTPVSVAVANTNVVAQIEVDTVTPGTYVNLDAVTFSVSCVGCAIPIHHVYVAPVGTIPAGSHLFRYRYISGTSTTWNANHVLHIRELPGSGDNGDA